MGDDMELASEASLRFAEEAAELARTLEGSPAQAMLAQGIVRAASMQKVSNSAPSGHPSSAALSSLSWSSWSSWSSWCPCVSCTDPAVDYSDEVLVPQEHWPSSPLASTSSASTQHTFKVSPGDDIRRFRGSGLSSTDGQEAHASVCKAVCGAFEVSPTGFLLKYEDEDKDLRTLVAAAVHDFLDSSPADGPKKLQQAQAEAEQEQFPPGVKRFSIATPPGTPRSHASTSAMAASSNRTSSIEDERSDRSL